MWMQGSTYTQPWHQEEVEWLVLRSAIFTPSESPQFSFYSRLSEPQDQSGHKRAKKNLHLLRHPGLNLSHSVHIQVPCHLSYLAHFRESVVTCTFYFYGAYFNFHFNPLSKCQNRSRFWFNLSSLIVPLLVTVLGHHKRKYQQLPFVRKHTIF